MTYNLSTLAFTNSSSLHLPRHLFFPLSHFFPHSPLFPFLPRTLFTSLSPPSSLCLIPISFTPFPSMSYPFLCLHFYPTSSSYFLLLLTPFLSPFSLPHSQSFLPPSRLPSASFFNLFPTLCHSSLHKIRPF